MTDARRYDFTVTRFGIPCPHTHSLNAVMEFEHVIRVLPGRMVTEPHYGIQQNWPPAADVELDEDGQILVDAEKAMYASVRAEGWDLMFGYSSQQGGRNSAIMHASEFLGGMLADDILDTPGVYVVLEVAGLYPSQEAEEADCDDPVGWAVAYSQT